MDEIVTKIAESVDAEVFEAETCGLAHIGDYDGYDERLREALADYEYADACYKDTDPNKEDIMDAAALVEEAAKTLLSRAMVAFYMYPPSEEHKEKAQEIMDRVTKDANCRERTCSQYFHALRRDGNTLNKNLSRLFKEKQKRMRFLNRCMRTQSFYEKKLAEGSDAGNPLYAIEKKAAAIKRRMDTYIPKGERFCPPQPFPHDPIPEGQPLPNPPDPLVRVMRMAPEGGLVFNPERHNFELPPDYISEDGLIDSESVVWDYDNHKVTMKYRGGVPVTWDFIQMLDDRDVYDPNAWSTQYRQRIFDQNLAESRFGLFIHRVRDGDIPEYNRIPSGNSV